MIQRQHLFTTRVEVARCGRYQYRRAFISTGSDLGARKERHSAFPFPTSSDPSVLATRSCFLKKGIQEEISKWHFENQPSTVSKNDIPEIVKEAYHLASSLSNVISSWKRSKIYPFDPEGIVAVMESKVIARQGETTPRPLTLQQHIEEMLVTITPIPLPIRKKSTSRVTLRKNGRAIMLSGPEAALWEKEDQLWKLLREGLKPQLISLCTEHKVDATGTMREMRGRIAPEL